MTPSVTGTPRSDYSATLQKFSSFTSLNSNKLRVSSVFVPTPPSCPASRRTAPGPHSLPSPPQALTMLTCYESLLTWLMLSLRTRYSIVQQCSAKFAGGPEFLVTPSVIGMLRSDSCATLQIISTFTSLVSTRLRVSSVFAPTQTPCPASRKTALGPHSPPPPHRPSRSGHAMNRCQRGSGFY